MSVFTIVLVFISFIIWLYYLLQPSKKLKKFGMLFPGPELYPVIGNVPAIGVNSKRMTYALWSIADKYGSTFRLFLGKDLNIFLADPENIEIVLVKSKELTKSKRSIIAGKPWIGDGLLIGPVEKWKKNRKRMLPAFHLKILQNFVPIFRKNSQKLIEEFSAFVDGPDVNISKTTAMYALRNICETAMGVSADSLSENNRYPKTVEELNALFLTKIFVPLLEYKLVYNLLPLGWKEKKLLKYVDAITEKVIQSRREEKRKWDFSDTNDENLADGQKKRLIFVDLLLHIQQEDPSFSDQQIRDEINTFLFAGHDTVAVTLSFCLYLLSKNHEAQEKIFQETDRILGGTTRPLEFADLQEMKYLEQVIKETLRMYTSVPMIGRSATSDIKLKNGLIIPAGADIIIWMHRMHNDPELYPNPTVFNPDNFTTENINKRHPYSFLPFGGGTRDCIGMKYAFNELKIGIANLVRQFIFLPSDSQKDLYLITEIVLKAQPGIHLKIKKR